MGAGVVGPELVEAAIAASTLSPHQIAAVRSLKLGGDRVGVMVGRAGTGKTHTLGTQLYETAGWSLVGLAPSAEPHANCTTIRDPFNCDRPPPR